MKGRNPELSPYQEGKVLDKKGWEFRDVATSLMKANEECGGDFLSLKKSPEELKELKGMAQEWLDKRAEETDRRSQLGTVEVEQRKKPERREVSRSLIDNIAENILALPETEIEIEE